MNRLPLIKRQMILHALCEGMSQRSCARVFDVDLGTVVKLFREAGDMAIAWMNDLKDLVVVKFQADELYAFIGGDGGEFQAPPDGGEGAGKIWGFLAIDVDTKLIFAYHLGARGYPDAAEFGRKCAATLKRNPDGSFVVRPSIATDGLSVYESAFDAGFGDDRNQGAFVKKYSAVDEDGNKLPSSRYQGADRRLLIGEMDEVDINTWCVERQNLNVRMGNRRYTRRSNAFSKRLLDHERHLALWIMYHNLCWIPRPARPPAGSPKGTPWIKRLPAAMEAGIVDRLWDVGDLLALTDAFIAERKAAEIEAERKGLEVEEVVIDAAEVRLEPSHWVFHSHLHHSTKVHDAGCANCRDGQGKGGSRPGTAEWLPFYCLEDAAAAAEALAPDRNSICSMCLGSYRSRGYRDPR